MKNKFLLAACCFLFSLSTYAVTIVSYGGRFSANYTSNCTPANITLNDISSPGGTLTRNVQWNDGTAMTPWSGTSISHNYLVGNTYDIHIDYYGSMGAYLGHDIVRIEVYGQPGPVESVYGSTSACPNDRVRLEVSQGLNPSPGMSYSWNWGDGSPLEVSSSNDLYHTYTAVGTYNVTVTATGGPCPGTYTSNGTVTIGTGIPLPPYVSYNIYMIENKACPMQEVYFAYPNEFASSFVQWGDGTYSSSGEHRHAYPAVGTYYPTVTITNGCGSSFTLRDTIEIVNNVRWNPASYISVNNSSPICPGSEVRFDTYSGAVSQTWYNQAGSPISTETYFKTTFNSTDSVYVVLTNGCGYDTTIYSIVQVVSNIPIDEHYVNTYVPSSVCTGSQFAYSADYGDDPQEDYTYTWTFGTGAPAQNGMSGYFEYPSNGTYNGMLHIKNTCGMDTTINFTVTAGTGIAPDPMSLNYFVPEDAEVCPGDSALFVGLYYTSDGIFTADFGDGVIDNTPETLQVMGATYFYFTHAYSAVGSYNTSMTFTNGCGLSITKNLTVNVGSNYNAVSGAFFDEATSICLGEPINFHGFGGNQFVWDFGDGTGTLVTNTVMDNVPHVYENPGSYLVAVQVTNGCGYTELSEINVLIPDNRINITTNTIDASCGEADGKAISVITGGNPPYNVTWSNGSSEILVDSLSSGIYVCNVSDQNGCYNFGIATVSDAEAPAIVVNTVVDVTCHGGHDGAIDINVIGSSGPYHYSWSNGSTSEDLSGLVAGPYEVYVTNAYGCVATASINVEQPEEVKISFLVTDASCGGNDGKIQASANGSSGPFTYVWSGTGFTGPNYNGLDYGIYEVNVIDSKGCVVTAQTTVDEDNGMGGPVIALNSISNLDCGGTGSTIDISVFATTGTPTYAWSHGPTTQDVTVTNAGNYTVTVTDGSCHAIEVYTINHANPAVAPVCMVSVDSMYAANKVIWEKPVSTDIAYFKIYRESSQAGLYYHVGSVPYDSLSIFTDVVANPQIQSWRYKLSVVDECGAESALSEHHKTIHLNQNLGLAPGSVNLIWDDYEGFPYSTFNVVRYTQAAGYVTLAGVSSLNHSYTDPAAPLSDSTLFYIITLDMADPCVSTRAQNNNTVRSNRSDNAIMIPSGVGVNETPAGYGYTHIYPNPANENLTVEFEVTTPADYTIQVVDALGQQVLSMPCGKIDHFCKKEISLSAMQRGVYFVNIVSAEGRISKRVVKL